jgi:Rieske Fe-S protein
MSRRAFVSAATLAAVAVVLDACSSGSAGGFTGPTGGAFTVKVSDFAALATVGGIARVESSGAPTALVRTGATSFAAFSMVCPHQGSTINITSGSFTCPNHGAQFTAAGVWKGGERTGNLTSYSATFDAAAGTVAIGRP